MISMPLRGRAAPVALALLLSHAPIVCEAVAQAPPGGQSRGEYNAHDANAQARALTLADEVIAFIGEGYRTIPPGEVLARMDSYRARMRTLAAEIADTPAAATLTTFLTQFEQIRADIAAARVRPGLATSGVTTTPPTSGDTAPARLRALLAEVTAANAYADLPPPQRLAALDAYLARLQALGPELAGTSVAAIYERTLREGRQERASIAAQLGRDPSMTLGADEGAYTDFEWMGQRGITALSNPLQREDFRASLARGIDFNVGVSAIEPTAAGWLVQMSGRPGTPATPGQGFFCRVNGTDTASLTVLRGIMPPYGIVHMTSSRTDEFVLSDRPLRVRIVFADCRITPPDDGRRRTTTAAGIVGGPPQAGGRVPPAPSPANLRCDVTPLRREPERAMAHRLRQAWAIPEALRDDPTLQLTFAVTMDFDAVLTAPVELLRSTSQRATPEQLRAAVEAGRQAITASAPFPELGPLAGGTMQIDMTPCD